MSIEVIERVNKIGTAQGQTTQLTFQDRHGYDNNDPDPYFQLIDHKIEGVIDDEPIEGNVEDDHEDMNIDPADQDQEVNEAYEAENEKEVPILADEADIEELPDELVAQAVPEMTEEPLQQRRSERIPVPVTIF